MYKLAIRTFSLLFLLSASLCAQSYSLWDYHPLHMGGEAIRIGKANCEGQPGNVHFRKSNVFLSMMTPIDQHNIFIPRVEFNSVTFDWNKNPKFHDTHFYYMQFGLLFFTTSIEDWKWIARFNYNLQIEHLSHPGQYSLYDMLLWGIYKLHQKWHYHIGALGYAGLESFNIYPIIGLDFAPNEHWLFKAIFPITYVIEYKFNSEWSLALKGRPLKERLRAGSKQPQPRSVFSYSSVGAELDLRYDLNSRLIIDLYGGYNLGGTFYIKNANGHNSLYSDLGSAPYGGATLEWAF